MAVVFGAAQATTSVDEKALVRNRKKTNRALLSSLWKFFGDWPARPSSIVHSTLQLDGTI